MLPVTHIAALDRQRQSHLSIVTQRGRGKQSTPCLGEVKYSPERDGRAAVKSLEKPFGRGSCEFSKTAHSAPRPQALGPTVPRPRAGKLGDQHPQEPFHHRIETGGEMLKNEGIVRKKRQRLPEGGA